MTIRVSRETKNENRGSNSSFNVVSKRKTKTEFRWRGYLRKALRKLEVRINSVFHVVGRRLVLRCTHSFDKQNIVILKNLFLIKAEKLRG